LTNLAKRRYKRGFKDKKISKLNIGEVVKVAEVVVDDQ
jgi:hypothetical protein